MELLAKQHNKALLTLDNIASVEQNMATVQTSKRAAKKGTRPAKPAVNVKDNVTAAVVPQVPGQQNLN